MSVDEVGISSQSKAIPVARRWLNGLSAYATLTKPGIMVLLLFTAFAAMVVADRGIPSWRIILAALLGLAMSTGGSAAMNMWYDRDIDAVMRRTHDRPIPAGEVSERQALLFGLALIVVSTVELYVFVNRFAAILSVAGVFYYVVIYTMWLKRRTPQNIVIGGGAGAMPPLIGWVAVTGQLNWVPVLMFLVIFLWTPPHFWSLALYRNEDYRKAHIPMMPTVRGPRTTKRQSVGYAVLLFASCILLAMVGHLNTIFYVVAIAVNVGFLIPLVRMWREPDGESVWCRRSFFVSLFYLLLVFVAMMIGVVNLR